jgi:hypothetical protein
MVGPAHQHRGWQVVEHGGGQGGYGSWMMRLPELHMSVVVLFNHFLWDMQDYALKVADLFLEEKKAPKPRVEPSAAPQQTAAPVELSAEQLEMRAGTYFIRLRQGGRSASMRMVVLE